MRDMPELKKMERVADLVLTWASGRNICHAAAAPAKEEAKEQPQRGGNKGRRGQGNKQRHNQPSQVE
jgi:hypothetical protein